MLLTPLFPKGVVTREQRLSKLIAQMVEYAGGELIEPHSVRERDAHDRSAGAFEHDNVARLDAEVGRPFVHGETRFNRLPSVEYGREVGFNKDGEMNRQIGIAFAERAA